MALAKTGISLVQVANILGVSRQRVSQVCKQHGHDPREAQHARSLNNKDTVRARSSVRGAARREKREGFEQLIANARRSGMTYQDIYSEFDTTAKTALRIITKHGLLGLRFKSKTGGCA